MNPQRPDLARRSGAAIAAIVLLPALLAGCEAEAVELVREIEAARGDCTPEGLRASDEECVRMMERYTSMGTELVHTYLGGLRTLDLALDRMPPPAFDTAGVGYAISPELRQGDPAGLGGSPRLAPARANYSYDYRPAASRTEPARRSDDPRSRRDLLESEAWRADARRGLDRSGRYGRYGNEPSRSYSRGRYGGFGSPAPFGLGGYAPFDGGRYTPFGSGYGYDPFGSGYGYDPFGSGYGYGFDGGYGYGYDPPGSGYRYDPAYGYDPGYGYDYRYGSGGGYAPYGYDRYAGRGGFAPGVGWSGAGYGPYDGYGYDPYDPRYADGSYARAPAPGGGVGYDDLSPAEAWGYDAAMDPQAAPRPASDAALNGPDGGTGPDPRSAVPARPAPHRPGILLPPEERLRRPWLND